MSEKEIKVWNLEDLRPIKDWSIKDFTPYRIKNKHLLFHAAFLYHEIDPAFDQPENTWWVHPFFRDIYTAPYFKKIGTNKIYPRTEIANPLTKRNNPAHDWKGILPWERRTKPIMQCDDMESYLGPLGPIDASEKQETYHAEKIEMDYHEIWVKIEKTYNILLTAAKEGTLPARTTTSNETDLSATRGNLIKFFAKILNERPRFLFPDNRGSEQVQSTQNEDKEQTDFDGFIRGLQVSYESDREVSVQTPGQKPKCFNHEALRFRDSTTREWKTLLDILRTTGLTYAFGPANTYSKDGSSKIKKTNPEYSAARKRIEAISKKLVDFFEKHYNLLNAPKNYKIYEALPGVAGTVQLKFKQETVEQVLDAQIDGGYNGYRKEDILKNLKTLAKSKDTTRNYLAARIKEAKIRGVTKEDLENILPPSLSALLL